ncbi:YqaA family protein [Ferrimonas sediminicola]|uniref:YqaA family protein n=1 Tax=Ferrimonas sediminicola TaxID=2569538 RepID=UPI00145C7320|nr:VTT domain-containing protein [Ferrimonas sediminicola]
MTPSNRPGLRRRSLAAFAFLEGVILPVPAELVLAPLCRLEPRHWLSLAWLTVFWSVVGGLLAYLVARWGMDSLVLPLVKQWGYEAELTEVLELYRQWGVWVLAVSGLTPLPYKLATLAAGASGVSWPLFLVAASVSRASRYLLVAWVAKETGRMPRGYAWLGWVILGVLLCALLLVI